MIVNEALPFRDRLRKKIYSFGFTLWKEKWRDGIDEEWLSNFQDGSLKTDENLEVNMLYLLSKFMFFGNLELRQLLLSLYRDLYKYPIIERIRETNDDTVDVEFIEKQFNEYLMKTRFIGVQEPGGSPSESGTHLSLYLRQECKLSTKNIISIDQILKTEVHKEKLKNGRTKEHTVQTLADYTIQQYIFFDDVCGGGTQVIRYLKKLIQTVRKKNDNCEINYFMLFGTEKGIKNLKKSKLFNRVEAVYILDESFRAFAPESRYYDNIPSEKINKKMTESIAKSYGKKLYRFPLGHANCQLLLGLAYNTPNNTLPIFWGDKNGWKYIFKRYEKITK